MRKFLLILSVILLGALSGCRKNSFEDKQAFVLHYMGISNIHPGETATTSPSWLGDTPENFSIPLILFNGNIFYQPKIDGPLTEDSSFYVDPGTGIFKIQNTSSLKAGIYKVTVNCSSGGQAYEFADAIIITMLKEK